MRLNRCTLHHCPDGRLQVSLVWVGVKDEETLAGHKVERYKVHSIRRDGQVALSMLAGGHNLRGLRTSLVVPEPTPLRPDGLKPSAQICWCTRR